MVLRILGMYEMSEVSTDKPCKERECMFNFKGVCTNATFDTEEPLPCYWED